MHDNWNEHERGGKWMSQKQEGDKVSVNAKKKCRQAIFISYCNPCVSECWRCTLQSLGPWHTCAANESANVINENDFLLFVFCHWFRFVFSLFFFDQHTLILRTYRVRLLILFVCFEFLARVNWTLVDDISIRTCWTTQLSRTNALAGNRNDNFSRIFTKWTKHRITVISIFPSLGRTPKNTVCNMNY